ncbi:hypothetical protein GF373_04810 [bacterium]|nr:hypothetical protein [bacterium]
MEVIMYRIGFLILCLCFISIPCFAVEEAPSMPMPIPQEDTIVDSWLKKPVLDSQLLDDMESMEQWKHIGAGDLNLSGAHAKNGSHSLKMTSQTFTDHPSKNGRPPAACSAMFQAGGADWSEYNRLSFWVYPDMPGFRTISLSVVLHNKGEFEIPDRYGRLGRNFLILENQTWNHIVWEIPHLSRDKVEGVEISYRMQGNEPGTADVVTYYLDTLELQTVDPDHYLGWEVAAGEIAYSHTGYPLNGDKIALASDLEADTFQLVNTHSDTTVLTKEISREKTPTGTYQVLDFSDFNKPGIYILISGDRQTEPFVIGQDVWKGTIWKTLNCFYCLRCGTFIPGIHGTCHEDWLAEHKGKRIPYNGGWHDAGDLSQGLRNTCEAAYALFLLAEQCQSRDTVLAGRLIEEAKWGLDWILKNRFGNGYRCRWGTMDFWTDNIIGTVDDMVTDNIVDDPYHNFHAAAAEAIAYRLLKQSNPYMARRALLYAEEDWQFAVEKDPDARLDTLGIGALASIELYKSTNKQKYANKAVALANAIMACQQQEPTAWDIPMRGFFYRSTKKSRIQHYAHIGEIQSPIAALTELCRELPAHGKQEAWRKAVRLFTSYLKTIAEYTQPYGMIPASIYSVDESKNPLHKEQVKNGIRLSEKYYLRRFPVWYDFRGNYGVLLSQTRALTAGARLLNDKALLNLAQKQLQWVVGLNPFCQSTMYGEGHDYAPQYTATSGNIVGGLPVGVQTSRNFDAPFWPSDNCYNFKEIWVHPSSRWLAIMADLEAMKE